MPKQLCLILSERSYIICTYTGSAISMERASIKQSVRKLLSVVQFND